MTATEDDRAESMLLDGVTRVFVSRFGLLRTVVQRGDFLMGNDSRDLLQFDTKRTDREYWRQVRCFLQWLGGYVQRKEWWRAAYKCVRRDRFIKSAKDWDDVITGEVRRWAQNRLLALSRDCACVDNSRVARRGNTGQMRRYKRQRAGGCCGFIDVVERCPVDSKLYLLGFNYGH